MPPRSDCSAAPQQSRQSLSPTRRLSGRLGAGALLQEQRALGSILRRIGPGRLAEEADGFAPGVVDAPTTEPVFLLGGCQCGPERAPDLVESGFLGALCGAHLVGLHGREDNPGWWLVVCCGHWQAQFSSMRG